MCWIYSQKVWHWHILLPIMVAVLFGKMVCTLCLQGYNKENYCAALTSCTCNALNITQTDHQWMLQPHHQASNSLQGLQITSFA